MICNDKEWPSIREVFFDTICSEEKSSIEDDIILADSFVANESILLDTVIMKGHIEVKRGQF